MNGIQYMYLPLSSPYPPCVPATADRPVAAHMTRVVVCAEHVTHVKEKLGICTPLTPAIAPSYIKPSTHHTISRDMCVLRECVYYTITLHLTLAQYSLILTEEFSWKCSLRFLHKPLTGGVQNSKLF